MLMQHPSFVNLKDLYAIRVNTGAQAFEKYILRHCKQNEAISFLWLIANSFKLLVRLPRRNNTRRNKKVAVFQQAVKI
jgi:hypothetical protein